MRCVYTAITNKYDTLLQQPLFVDVEYIVFTDDPTLDGGQWSVVYVPNLHCRELKILRHKYVGEYEHSLWITATV